MLKTIFFQQEALKWLPKLKKTSYTFFNLENLINVFFRVRNRILVGCHG